MKITCLQENLEKALSLSNRITVAKTALQLTNHVLLKAKDKEIHLMATDLENAVDLIVAGKIDREGGILLPTRTLIEIVNSLPKEQVEIEVEETTAKISCGRYEVRITGVPAGEFPELPVVDRGNLIIDEIIAHIKPVVFATSSDDSRMSLTGVLVKIGKREIELVATDGYRLSRKFISRTNEKREGEDDNTFILPGKVIAEVTKIAREFGKEKDNDNHCMLSYNEQRNQALFSFDNIRVYARLIGGDFPPHEKIIPSGSSTRIVFDKDDFLSGVKLSSIFARESANIIRMKITGEELILSANAPSVGENVCRIEAKVEGDENEIAFNSRFLLDFIANIDSKEIAFEMTGPLNPGVFKIPGDESYLHIIMPVRVQG